MGILIENKPSNVSFSNQIVIGHFNHSMDKSQSKIHPVDIDCVGSCIFCIWVDLFDDWFCIHQVKNKKTSENSVMYFILYSLHNKKDREGYASPILSGIMKARAIHYWALYSKSIRVKVSQLGAHASV